VFVANPKKPPQIESILRRNKEKLLAFLKDFHNDKEGPLSSGCLGTYLTPIL
jgi:calcium binding protein 39